MGLLLSILVVCVGVIEALSCYEHFQYGVLHCATNVYERARRRSSVFLRYTSRRLRLLADESVEEEPPMVPEPTPPPPPKPTTAAPPAPKAPARLGKEDKIKIVKTLLEKPRRPRPVRSISMPEPIFAERDELTDIIDSLAMDTIEEVNIEVEDAELLTNEFEKLFENVDSISERSGTEERTERKVGFLEKVEKPEEKPKVDTPVVAPPKEPPKTGGPLDVKGQPPRPSRPSRSISLDCTKSYTELVSSYFAKTKSSAAPPKKSKSRARLLDRLDDATVKSDTPPVELIDETFEEIYKDVCVDVDDVTDYEEIEKSVLEEDAPKIEEPSPISNEVLLKAAQQLAEIIVRNLLKEVPKLSLGKPTFVLEIPTQRRKPEANDRSVEELRKQTKVVLEEVGNDWTDAEEKEVEEEIQKITSTMSEIGAPMEAHERRDGQDGSKPKDGKTDEKDEAMKKDKEGEKVQSAIPNAFGDVVEEEIHKMTSAMNQIGVPMTLDRNDERDIPNVIQKDREKQEEGKVDGVKFNKVIEAQTTGETTEKDKAQNETREDGKVPGTDDPERHEGTENDERNKVQPGNSVIEEIPKTITMEERRDTKEGNKLEEGKVVCTEANTGIEKQVLAVEKDKQQDWDKLISEGPRDAVEEIRKILSPIIQATVGLAGDSSEEKDIQKGGSKQDVKVGDGEAVAKPVMGEGAERDKPEYAVGHSREIPESISKELHSSDGDDMQKVKTGTDVKGDRMKPSQEGVLEKEKQDQQSADPTGNSAKTEMPIKEAINHLEEIDAEKDKTSTKTVLAIEYTQTGVDTDRILPKEDVQDMQKQESQLVLTAELLKNESGHPAVGGEAEKPETRKDPTTPEKGRKIEGNTTDSSSQQQEERQIKDILKKIGIPSVIADEDFVEVELVLQGDEISAKLEDSSIVDSVKIEEAGDKQDTTVQQQFPEEVPPGGDSVEEEIKKIIKASKVEGEMRDKETDGIKGKKRDESSNAVEIEATGKVGQKVPTAFGDSVEEEIRKTIAMIEGLGLEQEETVKSAILQQEVPPSAIPTAIGDEVITTILERKEGGGIEEGKDEPKGEQIKVEEKIPEQKNSELLQEVSPSAIPTAFDPEREDGLGGGTEEGKHDTKRKQMQVEKKIPEQKNAKQQEEAPPSAIPTAGDEVISTGLEREEGRGTEEEKHDTKRNQIQVQERIPEQKEVKLQEEVPQSAIPTAFGDEVVPTGLEGEEGFGRGTEEGKHEPKGKEMQVEEKIPDKKANLQQEVPPSGIPTAFGLQREDGFGGRTEEGKQDTKGKQMQIEKGKQMQVEEKIPEQKNAELLQDVPPSAIPTAGDEVISTGVEREGEIGGTEEKHDTKGKKMQVEERIPEQKKAILQQEVIPSEIPAAFGLEREDGFGGGTEEGKQDTKEKQIQMEKGNQIQVEERIPEQKDAKLQQKVPQPEIPTAGDEVISTGLEGEIGGTEEKHDTKGNQIQVEKKIPEQKNTERQEMKSAVGKPTGELTDGKQAKKALNSVEGGDINLLDPTAEEGMDNKSQQHVLQDPTAESSKLETGPPRANKPGPENISDSSKEAPEAFWLIFSGEYTKAMSKDWHSGHFSCWQCDEALTGQRYVLRDDHPYCIKCYESVFANVCEECNKIIGIDSKDLSYKDKHWHEACFLCNKCRVSLVDKQFGSKADKIYCGNCYDAQFASRCDGCGEIFRAGTKKMEYKTRQWHEKCFCCCVCKTPIGTKSFIPREQEIYCATCYEEKFATRCVKCNKIITSGGVTYKNEPWHRECFTCTNCNTSLAGQRFTSRDEKPYCADCFGELFAKRCTACSRPITGIGGTRFISFEDRHWHNDCFICASCKTSLVGRGFITDGDDIICPECAKQKLM